MATWYLATPYPAPSMNRNVVKLSATSYKEAKQVANNWVEEHGQSATLHDSDLAVYAWYRINAQGQGWDRNQHG